MPPCSVGLITDRIAALASAAGAVIWMYVRRKPGCIASFVKCVVGQRLSLAHW